jgi:glutathione S-transferase
MGVRDGLWRLYGSEISYFTGKVRPAFRWKRVPHLDVLATNDAYRRVIRPRIGFSMIPVVVTPEDETVQDSSDILDVLERRFPDPPLYPATPAQRIACHLIELYVDEFLPLPGLHWRWSYEESVAKARADFQATTGEARTAHRFADAVRGACPLYGIVPATVPAIEAHTREMLAVLEGHLAVHPYLLGGAPSLADCALMGPLYAHPYLDAVPGRLLRATAPGVCHWIERMNHPDPAFGGAWVAGDALPEGFRDLLRLAGRDTTPLVLDTVRAFEAWADAAPRSPEEEVPRGVGTHTTRLRGVEVERLTFSYTLWMVQRVLDAYYALDGAGRAAADRALAGTGFEALLAYRPRHRVERRPFKLYFARQEG